MPRPPARRNAFAGRLDGLESNTYARTSPLLASRYLRLDWRRLAVAVVVGLYSRRVVGLSMQPTRTAHLVMDALLMAICRRGRPRSVLHRSDRARNTRAKISGDCSNLRSSLQLELSGQLLGHSNQWSAFHTYSSPGWRADHVNDAIKTNDTLRIFFANRGIFYSARAGYYKVGHDADPFYWQSYKLVGSHYYYDPVSRVQGAMRATQATDCNLQNWGAGTGLFDR